MIKSSWNVKKSLDCTTTVRFMLWITEDKGGKKNGKQKCV